MTVAIHIHNDGPRKIKVTNTVPGSVEQGPGMTSVEVGSQEDAPIQYVHSHMSLCIDEISGE